jgi:hypothetical protein
MTITHIYIFYCHAHYISDFTENFLLTLTFHLPKYRIARQLAESSWTVQCMSSCYLLVDFIECIRCNLIETT